MKALGIVLLILGGILLLISGIYVYAYVVFEKSPHKTGRTLGRLCGRKYKKDVAVWEGFGKYDGPPRVAFTIKYLTKSKYLYCVNGKFYFCTFDFFKKPHKVPGNAWVVYLKAFPRISYLSNDENYVGALDLLVTAGSFFCAALCTGGLGLLFY